MNNFLNKISITGKFYLLIAIGLIGLIVVSGYLTLRQYYQTVDDRKDLVRQEVLTATGILKWAQLQEETGAVSRDQAQSMAKAAIGALRYGSNDYFWINDSKGVMLMHPFKPDLVGKDGSSIKDPNGFEVINEAAKLARKSGSGYLQYLWPKPGKDKPVQKVSFISYFEPWGWVVGSGLYTDDLHDSFLSSAWQLGIFVLVATISIAWFGYAISRTISRGLGKAVRVLHQIAQGDLSIRIHPRGHDEVAQLLFAMDAMQQQLTGLIRGIVQKSETVSTASTQIATGNADLSARTESQASSLEQTAASMEQLSSQVSQNAENARQASLLASNASSVAAKGGQVVGRVVETMQEINESSKRISDIIGVIDSIAFQTNILALNASVEAARAGEQGRGFAVVASEVRLLAGRSAEAAREIKKLITASVERVEHGTALVGEAGITMNAVVNSIQSVSILAGEISTASSEQAAGVEQIGEAVKHMDQVTQQNASLVEEVAAAAGSLRDQSTDLVKMAFAFKLDWD